MVRQRFTCDPSPFRHRSTSTRTGSPRRSSCARRAAIRSRWSPCASWPKGAEFAIVCPMKILRFISLAAIAAGSACASFSKASNPSAYEAFAIRYATIPGFRVSGLIAGADTSRRLDIAMMVWLLRSGGRTVIIDAGFQRPDLIQRWRPTNYVKPSEAVASAGVAPDQVTDVIISHIHWDHFDGADLFPKATIWIQKDEVEHHIDSTGKVLDRAIDAQDALML